MDMPAFGQLVFFVLLVSIPLLVLDAAMRRSRREGGRPGKRD